MGFEIMTSRTRVSTHNHLTTAPIWVELSMFGRCRGHTLHMSGRVMGTNSPTPPVALQPNQAECKHIVWRKFLWYLLASCWPINVITTFSVFTFDVVLDVETTLQKLVNTPQFCCCCCYLRLWFVLFNFVCFMAPGRMHDPGVPILLVSSFTYISFVPVKDRQLRVFLSNKIV